MRFLIRFFSLLSLAAAVIAAIIDSIQSVASQAVMLTPFGTAVFSVNPRILVSAEAYFRQTLSPQFWDVFVAWLLLQPAFAVFLILSLLFWILGYKRERASRFAMR